MKSRRFYYYDERRDDFANNGINGADIADDYQYLPRNILYRVFKPLVYYFVRVLCVVVLKLVMLVPQKNTRVLHKRRDLSKGYFVYSNHTSRVMDAISAPVATFPRQCYTIVNPDAISIKGVGTLVRMLGALPVPSSMHTSREFNKTIDRLYDRGCRIAIFPEAHIWPKYNKIRDFSPVSFHYPVRLNAPCFVKTTVYRKMPGGRTRPLIIYDGPFYPDPELSPREAKEDLCRRVFGQMKKRTEEYDSAPDVRYQYIKVDSPEQVKTVVERRRRSAGK